MLAVCGALLAGCAATKPVGPSTQARFLAAVAAVCAQSREAQRGWPTPHTLAQLVAVDEHEDTLQARQLRSLQALRAPEALRTRYQAYVAAVAQLDAVMAQESAQLRTQAAENPSGSLESVPSGNEVRAPVNLAARNLGLRGCVVDLRVVKYPIEVD